MNKTQLVDAVSADSGLSKADASRAVESVLATVTKSLKKGDEVEHHRVWQVLGRQTGGASGGRNPRTGERVKIKASKAPKFTAGATLKQAVSPKK